VGTKAGLAGGTVYVYYQAGLWKGSDETIENYAQFKKDVQTLYESTPDDFQKWMDYGASSLSSNVEPYQKKVSDFRKEWLTWDFSFLTESGDGILKPTWNKGVSWTLEVVKDSPDTMSRWGQSGWKMVADLASQTSSAPSPPSQKQ